MNVYISATLRNFFGKNSRLETDAKSIKDILKWLKDEYPESEKVLFDENGKLRSFIRIYVGDENRSSEDKWETSLSEDSEVLLLPAIAGGAPENDSIIPEERRKAVAFDDKEIQQIAWEKYGFRTGITGGNYDVSSIGIGVPQTISSTVSSLKMNTYNQLIEYLKNGE